MFDKTIVRYLQARDAEDFYVTDEVVRAVMAKIEEERVARWDAALERDRKRIANGRQRKREERIRRGNLHKRG